MENSSFSILKENSPFIILECKTNFFSTHETTEIALGSKKLNKFRIHTIIINDSDKIRFRAVFESWLLNSYVDIDRFSLYKIYIEIIDATTILIHSRVNGFFGKIINKEHIQFKNPAFTSTGIEFENSIEISLTLNNLRLATKSDLLEYLI